FGVGYSSLGYLRRFRFNRLKIDRTFIASMRSDPGSRDMVRAIISLARTFGMDTTAEGVEEHSDLVALSADGCTEVQGFLLSRPLGEDQIGAVMARQFRAAC